MAAVVQVLTRTPRRPAETAARPPSWPGLTGLALLALLVAVGSVLLTHYTPGYDPWSWLIWGRELGHGELSTVSGPAMKPLPVLICIPLSWLGSAAPTAWLVVARAGAAGAVLLAGRVARRLADDGTRRGHVCGIVAGAVAGAGLLLSTDWLGKLIPVGMSEPLLAALLLLAFDAILSRRPRRAFLACFLAALLRPEVWPFLLVGGVLLAWKGERRDRVLVVGGLLAVPVLWFGPDWWSAHDLLRSLHRASVPSQGGPLLTAHPWRAVLGEATTALPVAWGIAAVLTLVGLTVAARRRPTSQVRSAPVLALAALCWLVLEVGMTQLHASSGETRYLAGMTAGEAVLAGAGVGWALRQARWDLPRRWVPAVLVGLVSVVLVAADWPARFHQLEAETATSREHSAVEHDITRLVAQAGGPDLFRRCGMPLTYADSVPLAAWLGRLRLVDVLPSPATGVVLGVRQGTRIVPEVPPAVLPPGAHLLVGRHVILWTRHAC